MLNVINFQTGQLFDWFVSGGQVFALIERLPSSVTGGTGVGPDLMYAQIIKEHRSRAASTTCRSAGALHRVRPVTRQRVLVGERVEKAE